MRRTARIAIATATLAIGLVGCTSAGYKKQASHLEVTVGISACVVNSRECQTLRIPNVAVTITLTGGQKLSGSTDESGRAAFDVKIPGIATVEVKSPLLSKELAQDVNVNLSRETTTVAIIDPLPFQVTRPAR